MGCPFCTLINNPSAEDERRIVCQDDRSYVVSVLHPQSFGHIIAFPRRHIDSLEREPETTLTLFSKILELSPLFRGALGCDAFTVKANNAVWSLQRSDPSHVGHIHVHWIPLYTEADVTRAPAEASRDSIEKSTMILRQALSSRYAGRGMLTPS